MNYSPYTELLAAAENTPTQENLKNLWSWFFQNDIGSWTGEGFNLENGHCLYPVYDLENFDSDEINLDKFLKGYVIR